MVHHVHQCTDRHWVRCLGFGPYDCGPHHYGKSLARSVAHMFRSWSDPTSESILFATEAQGTRGIQPGDNEGHPYPVVVGHQVSISV